MPESDDVHPLFVAGNTIDDAIGANHNFANGRFVKLWDDPAHFREIGETPGAADQKLAERECALW
jgi:hypothetical protein